MNVVADTNVVISAIFWPGESRQCLALWAKRRFHLALTVPVFAEYVAVARRVAAKIPEVNPEPWLKWIERNSSPTQKSEGALRIRTAQETKRKQTCV
jgi:predicted nucleic acid-binding protein